MNFTYCPFNMLGKKGLACEKPKITINNCSPLFSNIAFCFALPVAFCFCIY